jgi:hypothetical protein
MHTYTERGEGEGEGEGEGGVLSPEVNREIMA